MFRWGGGSCIQNSKFEYKKTLFILTITRLRHLSLFTDLYEALLTTNSPLTDFNAFIVFRIVRPFPHLN